MSIDTNNAPAIKFPDLWRSGTLEMMPWMLFSAVAVPVLMAFSFPKLAMLAILPAFAFVLRDLAHATRNRALRRNWAGSFPQTIRPAQLLELSVGSPDRYRLHVRYYGGFDAVGLVPACVLEATQSGELSAVHPASWRALRYAEQRAFPLVEHRM